MVASAVFSACLRTRASQSPSVTGNSPLERASRVKSQLSMKALRMRAKARSNGRSRPRWRARASRSRARSGSWSRSRARARAWAKSRMSRPRRERYRGRGCVCGRGCKRAIAGIPRKESKNCTLCGAAADNSIIFRRGVWNSPCSLCETFEGDLPGCWLARSTKREWPTRTVR